MSDDVPVAGRATKRFIAFNVEEKTFCFLKDSWRPDSPSIHPELEVYEKLAPNNIIGIATVHSGGDLFLPTFHESSAEIQVTKTQTLPGATQNLRRIHTRIVLNEVAIPLERYRHSKELCIAILCALSGEFLF